MKLELSESELDHFITFLEDNMIISRRLKNIEDTQTALSDRVAAVEAEIAALNPANPQLAADVELLKGAVTNLNSILDVADDGQPA